MNGANNACPIKRLFFDTSPESKFYWKPPPSQLKFTRYRQRTFRTHACLTLQEASCRGQDQADHNVPITPRSLLLSPSHYIGPDNKDDLVSGAVSAVSVSVFMVRPLTPLPSVTRVTRSHVTVAILSSQTS